jgi:hypothetical protein
MRPVRYLQPHVRKRHGSASSRVGNVGVREMELPFSYLHGVQGALNLHAKQPGVSIIEALYTRMNSCMVLQLEVLVPCFS